MPLIDDLVKSNLKQRAEILFYSNNIAKLLEKNLTLNFVSSFDELIELCINYAKRNNISFVDVLKKVNDGLSDEVYIGTIIDFLSYDRLEIHYNKLMAKERTKNMDIINQIKDVIYNDPATIVLWKDGTKTVVKCQKDKGDTYNPEVGLAMCVLKKMLGNKSNYNNLFTKWLPDKS